MQYCKGRWLALSLSTRGWVMSICMNMLRRWSFTTGGAKQDVKNGPGSALMLSCWIRQLVTWSFRSLDNLPWSHGALFTIFYHSIENITSARQTSAGIVDNEVYFTFDRPVFRNFNVSYFLKVLFFSDGRVALLLTFPVTIKAQNPSKYNTFQTKNNTLLNDT